MVENVKMEVEEESEKERWIIKSMVDLIKKEIKYYKCCRNGFYDLECLKKKK